MLFLREMAAQEKMRGAREEGRAWSQPVEFGRFLLEKRLAVGGMSEVYLAKPAQGQSPASKLIIKRLLPSLLDQPQSRSAFNTEARVHMAACHPNVVEVFEAGEVGGEPYLAMEYVSGVDAFRLMRRAQSEQRPIPPGMAVYIARELCKALSCVHQLRDEAGMPLGIVHRDMTPSNVYLSETGDVKLGDFGIARSFKRARMGSNALKGKYAYLAPEQVSGDAYDHRADLFSLAVVLTELLIGKSLFPGAGQLAVLLAIRDCRIDPLRAAAKTLPSGMSAVLERGLAKCPDKRFATADELLRALAPFETPSHEKARAELATWVAWAADATGLAQRLEGVLRESGTMAVSQQSPPSASPAPERRTLPAPCPEAEVRTSDGRHLPGLSFAKLVELIVTGELDGQDEVSMAEQPYQRLASIEVLARHLPPSTGTTHRLEGPGVPDYAAELGAATMLEVLGWVMTRQETGALFADRRPSSSCPASVRDSDLEPSSRRGGEVPPSSGRGDAVPLSRRGEHEPGASRKELYFEKGRLVLVASSEPSELLGEYLVRQGHIDREELETALVALPRYDGRLGDTLIGLGMVDPVEMFQAIRKQGRARAAELFRWRAGRVSFYRGVRPQRVDFRLETEVPELMMAGVELALSDAVLREIYRIVPETMISPVRPPPSHAMTVPWPATVLALVGVLGTGRSFREIVPVLQSVNQMAEVDTVRALAVALAGGIVTKRDPPR